MKIDYLYQANQPLPYIPRIGILWSIPKDFESIQWHGAGPDPTYQDRGFENIGVFQSKLNDMWVEYSKPQENGNLTGIR